MKQYFNSLVNTVKNQDLLPYIWKWQYGRFASRFSFLPKIKAPFENFKIYDDEIIYNLIIKNLRQCNKKKGGGVMMARYGNSEHNAMVGTLLYEKKILPSFKKYYKQLCFNAGFFPYVQTPQEQYYWGKRFLDTMLQATENCDVFGTWNGHLSFEEFFIKKTKKELPYFVSYAFFEPHINSKIPFTYALKDTNVLVIHPFTKTIEAQYKNREKLFENQKVLPHFNLKTLKAVQTINGIKDSRFSNWFEALDWMYEQIEKIDFDIALIGCGAYGFPLASKIKNMGKIAIHCGGTLQLLFGIKGRRWEIEIPSVGEMLFNEYWVRPNAEETIKNNQNIENGCYW